MTIPASTSSSTPLPLSAQIWSSSPTSALAYRALELGGTAPCVLNAANEIAVEAFLAGKLGFRAMSTLIAQALEAHRPSGATTSSYSQSSMLQCGLSLLSDSIISDNSNPMDIAIRVLQLLLSLSILVFIHELGHYSMARFFGARVEKF